MIKLDIRSGSFCIYRSDTHECIASGELEDYKDHNHMSRVANNWHSDLSDHNGIIENWHLNSSNCIQGDFNGDELTTITTSPVVSMNNHYVNTKNSTYMLGNKLPEFKAVKVNRDYRGMWEHPDLPVLEEENNRLAMNHWLGRRGLRMHLVIMDGEIGKKWGNGEIESCLCWNPSFHEEGAFLCGVWDTEDGVVAMFASPYKVK